MSYNLHYDLISELSSDLILSFQKKKSSTREQSLPGSLPSNSHLSSDETILIHWALQQVAFCVWFYLFNMGFIHIAVYISVPSLFPNCILSWGVLHFSSSTDGPNQ